MTFKTIVKAAEPKTFTASILPVALGCAYAFYKQGSFHFGHTLLLIVGMILVQSVTNMINDYYDYKRQTDTAEKSDEKLLLSGELTVIELKKLIVILSGMAIAIGSYFALTLHLGIFLLMLIALIGLFAYSGGPLPISYTPFGEIVSGFLMGIMVIVTVIFILTGEVTSASFWVALPTFFYVGLLLLSNNISDWKEDQGAGRKTLVILCGGESAANWLWMGCFASIYIATALAVVMNVYHWSILAISLLALPYKDLLRVLKVEKNRHQKGLLMKTASHVGVVYHVIVILALIAVKLSHMD